MSASEHPSRLKLAFTTRNRACREIIEPEADEVEDSESIYILKQCVNPPLACNPVHRESPFITQAAFPTVRERQLESAVSSNPVVVSRVASASSVMGPVAQW